MFIAGISPKKTAATTTKSKHKFRNKTKLEIEREREKEIRMKRTSSYLVVVSKLGALTLRILGHKLGTRISTQRSFRPCSFNLLFLCVSCVRPSLFGVKNTTIYRHKFRFQIRIWNLKFGEIKRRGKSQISNEFDYSSFHFNVIEAIMTNPET